MTTLTAPAPAAAAAPLADSRRLAADLGIVLDALLEHTAQGFAERIQAHGLTLVDARVLRCLDRSSSAVLARDLADRAGLEPRTAARAAAGLRERDLVIEVAARRGGLPGGALPPIMPTALTLTRHGRAIVRDLDHTRRADLLSFVERLGRTERRRVEAAVSLLHGEL